MKKHKTLTNLHLNSRFYILASSFALSLLVAASLRLHIVSDQLYYIRLQQLFGYLCIIYWYSALIISPLGRIYKNKAVMGLLQFSRRGLGVSAAYFALLHVFVALWGQLGGLSGALLLPDWFLWSFAFGSIGLLTLSLMAITSFDKVIAIMTFPRWKWLHRLGYIGGIFVLIHIWMIGSHMSYVGFRSVIFVMLAFLLFLESLRISSLLAKKYKPFQQDRLEFGIAMWLVAVTILFVTPSLIGNYQDRHNAQQPAHNQGAKSS